METYRYKLTNLQNSSRRYGPCEVCGQPVSEVFLQTEERECEPGRFTSHKARGHTFGHRGCLLGQRRGKIIEHDPRGIKIVITNDPRLIGQPCVTVYVKSRRICSTSLGEDTSEKRALQIADKYIQDSYPDGEIVNHYHLYDEVKS